MNNNQVQQEYFSPSDIALKAGISRTTVYELNKTHRFIRKLGSRSLIKWTDFEEALKKESEDT